jgi:CRP-like cAMP-binding protein
MSLRGLFNYEEWSYDTQSFVHALSGADYDFLIGSREIQEFRKNEILFHEKTTATGFYYIHEGKVKKYKVLHDHEQILYIAGKGELVGYHAGLSQKKYPGSAAALENTMATFILNEDFVGLLAKSPALSMAMINLLSAEFAVYANNDLLHTQGNASQRVATALICAREKFKEDKTESDKLFVAITRTDLAQMAGLTEKTTIRTLAEFKALGIISTKGSKIWVKNLEKLVELTGLDESKY